MTTPLIIFGAVIILCTIASVAAPKKRGHAATAALVGATAHQLTTPPQINYSGNPNRIGAYVYVMENTTPDPSLDWSGTFIGMENGMALIRDTTTHVVAHVNRDQVYAAKH